MKGTKRLIALLATAILVFAFTESAAAQKARLPYPSQAIKIGVETYDSTDSEYLALQDYFKYLQKSFNVSFIYSETIKSAEQELAFIESCAAAGAKGFIGYYNVSKGEAVAKCAQYKMFYWGSAIDYPEVLSAYGTSPYLLSSVNLGNGDFIGGYEMGKYVIAQGCKSLVYASGGADFGVPMFIQRRQGFLKAVEEAKAAGKAITVIDVKGFPGDAFFAAQNAALTKDIDAVCASFNGADFWAQPIAAAGKSGKVKLATIGSLNEAYRSAFKSKSVDLLVASNMQRYGFAVAMIVNAVDGNAKAYAKDGKATTFTTGFWVIGNPDDFEALYKLYTGPDKIYSAEELLSVVVGYNPKADMKLLEGLVKSFALKDVLARRK